ncbi:MAG: sugar ABC transporter permease [Alphaproteobacteria bacterium]|nr:sugar ABC transporter permease [Alphaproteobacteria bacterium]
MALRFSMRARRAATAYLLILPFFAVFGLFWAGPIAASFLYSFTEWRGITPPSPVGLRNYENLLYDERFFTALGNTLWMAGLYVAIANTAALSLALALDSGWMRLRQFFRTAFFLPMTLSMVVAAVIFQLVYAGDIGLLAKLLAPLGIEIPALLRDPATAPYALVAMRVWRTTGYYAIIYLAGLQAISSELREAARLDGASELNVIRHVVLPGLKPVALFCIVLSTVSGLEMFDEPMVLTQGGPGDSTLTVVMFVYQQGFQFLQLGYAAAASYVLTVLIVLVSLVQRFWLRERGR